MALLALVLQGFHLFFSSLQVCPLGKDTLCGFSSMSMAPVICIIQKLSLLTVSMQIWAFEKNLVSEESSSQSTTLCAKHSSTCLLPAAKCTRFLSRGKVRASRWSLFRETKCSEILCPLRTASESNLEWKIELNFDAD